MPTVLAIVPGIPRALEGRSLFGDRLSVEISSDPAERVARAAEEVFDLLVLCGMSVDEQQAVVSAFHANRRWRLVPVLYVAAEDAPGLAIPGTFRPEIDGLSRGTLESPQVQKRISELEDDLARLKSTLNEPGEPRPRRKKSFAQEADDGFWGR